ncbi:TRAF family member-associated NF-kappa-B activator isoform X2 [Oncorhynchus keta]|uniref:TRAF family member-associated NF-kappa-B activator isoform X2 n=1 Tax=Oncorhynchus keta TaxID=8018 RepID=UPI0015F828F7|nr:TRAF family member-associated NF-kappa-B activator isoform X2 [Oncorhynchus keta]
MFHSGIHALDRVRTWHPRLLPHNYFIFVFSQMSSISYLFFKRAHIQPHTQTYVVHKLYIACRYSVSAGPESSSRAHANAQYNSSTSCDIGHLSSCCFTLEGNMETAMIVSPSPHTAPVNNSFEKKDVFEAFQALQGKFQQIQTLTRRQKDHLKKISKGNYMANEQQFSMPIQCTDVTAEQAERPFPSAPRPVVILQHPPTSLASRGASQEDRDLVDSLTRLSVKFPPSTDSEYEFLNSAPEKHFDLSMPKQRAAVSSIPAVIEESSMELAIPFLYPTSPSHPTSPSTSLSHESVRGPLQPLWSPELCDAAAAQAVSAKPQQQINNSPDICAYCNAEVPQDHMKSHLFTHCQRESEASN